MDIRPTAEFVAEVSDQQIAARKEVENVAVTFYRLFGTDDGRVVLAFLRRFVNRPVPLENLPHGAVHKEGQAWLLREIETQIDQGERARWKSD